MRSKEVEFQYDVEIEVKGTCTPFIRGRGPSMDHSGGEPDEPAGVEDLYVGVIIKGIAIDITDKLTKKQKDFIETRCLEYAADEDTVA